MSEPAARTSTYRADIDGLRALAVVAVILCHVGTKGFAGGFLGVDVFFVISGYLIHRDLVGRLASGRLSIVGFYGRRLRRTLPALLVATALTFMASIVVLLPRELEALARSMIGVLASVPNVVFLAQVGYFDPDAATKPLLHTWSLGVEEQFYLVAPLLALAIRPLVPQGRAAAMLATFVASFAFTLLLQAIAPAAAFYLMPARIFEFMAGAMLAEDWLPRLDRRVFAETATAIGLAGLVFSFIAFDAAVPHPGWPTLLPCVCSAALIYGGAARRTAVTAILSAPLPVAIGRISYSLYLYHWPILVLARYAEFPTTLPWRAGEAILLLVLSIASFFFIERPFRSPASPWRRRAPILLPMGAVTLLASCLLVLAMAGLPRRFGPDIVSLEAFSDYRNHKPFREGRCFLSTRTDSASLDRQVCLALSPNKPNVLVVGDSHAAHLWSGLSETWPHINFLQATASGCIPGPAATGASRCTSLMHEMFDHFIPDHKLDAVIVSALWGEADIEPLRRTLAGLAAEDRRVIVFGPLPRYDVPMATLLARAMLHHDLDDVARHRIPGMAELDDRMRAAVAPLATYVSLWRAACPDGVCRLFAAPGVPMQFDYHHLTAKGAAALMATVAASHPDLFGGPAAQGAVRLSTQ